jgi:hypothetical protein
MLTKGRLLAAVFLTFVLVFCFAGSAFAQRGGIYLDQIRIYNDSKVIFSDDFDDGNVSDWNQLANASLITVDQERLSRILWMNKQEKTDSIAWHKLDMTQVGSVELSAAVYVAPAIEQYEWQNKNFSAFSMHLEYRETPNSPADTLRIEVILYQNDQSCYVAAKRNSVVVTDCFNKSKQPVLATGKWARLTLRLDPTSGTATACLNDSPVASVPYDPVDFPRITSLAISSSFGDGALRAE